MVVTSEVEGLVVVTSVVLGRVSVVLVVGTVVALTVFSSLAPVLTATFVVGDFSVVITSGAVVDFFVVIAVFVIVGGVGVVTSSHSCSKHCSSVIGLSLLLHHFAFGSSFESAKHLTFLLRIPTPQLLEHDSQG